jgi:hypothetical protein
LTGVGGVRRGGERRGGVRRGGERRGGVRRGGEEGRDRPKYFLLAHWDGEADLSVSEDIAPVLREGGPCVERMVRDLQRGGEGEREREAVRSGDE